MVAHEIWMDAGDNLSSAYTKVAGYDGTAQTYTITTGLRAAGALHRIRVRAKNALGGLSEFSEALFVAVGPVPVAPAAPVKDVAKSGPGEIAVDWAPLAAAALPLTGYRLYSDLGRDDVFTLIYDG